MIISSQSKSIPAIFAGVEHNEYTPQGIEKAQATFNEEGLYKAITCFAQEWYKKSKRKAKVLDLCSSTGLCAWRLTQVIPVERVTLVDIDNRYLQIAIRRFQDICSTSIFCEDAISFNNEEIYDLILMNSAYHHIENERKLNFIKNATSLLSGDGKILVGDNFLPSSQNSEEFRQSVVIFYSRLLQELKKQDESNEAIEVIRKSALNCWQGIEEYKVSFSVLKQNLVQSGLSIEQINYVWVGDTNQFNKKELWGSFAMSINPNQPI